MNHIEFEKILMDKLLAGDDPVLEGLRNQHHNSVVESRKFTGAGFYTHFKLKKCVNAVTEGKSFQIGDVDASLKEILEAFGFILFIEKGYLSVLEGYTLSSDCWPDDYSGVLLKYDGLNGIRDFDKLKMKWA
jgi:hypothetical protein